MAAKIRKGDPVVVLTGKDKGRTGTVTRVFPKEQRVLVGGEHAQHVADLALAAAGDDFHPVALPDLHLVGHGVTGPPAQAR